MVKNFSQIIMIIMGYVLFLTYYIVLLLFSPILWIIYRLFPCKKRLIEVELEVRVIDLSLTVQGSFEGLLGNKKIYRAEKKEKTLPFVYYISKNDFTQFAEHIRDKTVLATIELSYWKYGFGKSRLVSYKLLDKPPRIRK